MNEKPYRSIIKAISWRVMATIDTIIVSYLISRKFAIAFSIGFVELFTKIGLYYLHERIWNKIKLGKQEPNIEYQI